MRKTPFFVAMTLLAGLAAGQADNTKNNKDDRDPASRESTPQNATETKEDLEVLKNIRKAITDDKALSTYAQNVKITVKNGVVTLRGPVRTGEERVRIERLAARNGASSVINNLEIAPKQ